MYKSHTIYFHSFGVTKDFVVLGFSPMASCVALLRLFSSWGRQLRACLLLRAWLCLVVFLLRVSFCFVGASASWLLLYFVASTLVSGSCSVEWLLRCFMAPALLHGSCAASWLLRCFMLAFCSHYRVLCLHYKASFRSIAGCATKLLHDFDQLFVLMLPAVPMSRAVRQAGIFQCRNQNREHHKGTWPG